MILDEILAHKRVEVAERIHRRPIADLQAALAARARASGDARADIQPGPFARALREPGVRVIAEIKRKSPSGGELRPGASAAELATLYAANGAAALSVLTDTRFFGGSDADLVSARDSSRLPVLRKDFVVDAYQVYEAATLGADAILLIVRSLTDPELREFLQLATELKMDALVETHSAAEVERALQANATIIGVNNRDLDTLVTDVTLAPRLRSLVPKDRVFVAESGLSRPEQLMTLGEAEVDAVLIGETLVRSADPGAALRAFVMAPTAASIQVSR